MEDPTGIVNSNPINRMAKSLEEQLYPKQETRGKFGPDSDVNLIGTPGAGVKWDDDKLRYDLESPHAREGLVRVLTYGAKKYAARNWEKGISWMRIYAAVMRHLALWVMGEEIDAESGLSHLDHAACCIHFLQHYQRIGGKQFDDRPKPPVEVNRG